MNVAMGVREGRGEGENHASELVDWVDSTLVYFYCGLSMDNAE